MTYANHNHKGNLRELMKATSSPGTPQYSTPTPTTPAPSPTTPAIVYSNEQEAIFDEYQNGVGSIVVNANAGSGKTSTSLESADRNQRSHPGMRQVYLVFGKANQEEMVKKAAERRVKLPAITYHSLGNSAITRNLGRMTVDKGRVWTILDRLKKWDMDNAREVMTRSAVKTLVGLAKKYGAETRDQFDDIIERHDILLSGGALEEVYDLTQRTLSQCALTSDGVIDFDDMPWLPWKLNLPFDPYDISITDESQDLDPVQMWLIERSAHRVMVIGDVNQAIFGFRGASSRSMPELEAMLRKRTQVTNLRLSVTRRSPKSHVELAQQIVPGFRYADYAPDGVIETNGDVTKAKSGDLVICRVNAPLISCAYRLISKGIPATIKGRDLIDGLEGLIKKAQGKQREPKTLKELISSARKVTTLEVETLLALPKGKGEVRAANAEDKLECLVTASEGCRTSNDLINKLRAMFEDKDNSVNLGSIHGTKGLEAHRVFVLDPEKIPHPNAKKPWQQEQELNLAYIAVTRAKFKLGPKGEVIEPGTLTFCGGMPPAFDPEQYSTQGEN